VTHPIKGPSEGSDTPARRVSFLLLSGGVGARSGHHAPKQFFDLVDHPMIAYALMAAAQVDRIAEVIVNAPEGYAEQTREIAQEYCPGKDITIIPGGDTRQESSLSLAGAAHYDTVILHEAARPFVTTEMLETLIDCAHANVGFCLPIPFSMCRVDTVTGAIVEGVPRETVLNIQLPQKFDRSTLIAAHSAAITKGAVFTEDAVMVLEMTGQPVQSLLGSSKNLKVTTPEDFSIAKVTLEKGGT
jgi:2-C-methyl-D-erythritol 4-phosphate cytidylyltransferase